MSRRAGAILALEDGEVFHGFAGGEVRPDKPAAGEVVFNTALAGYQEILTDPSYAGQIISMTYPHIGNYGVNAADAESRSVFASGLVVRDLSRIASSWRSEGPLEEFLAANHVRAITGVDTRRLTRHIRDRGAMTGVIVHGEADEAAAIELARSAPRIEGRDLVGGVSTRETYIREPAGTVEFEIAAYDFGIKARILDCLTAAGMRVTVLPANTSAETVLSMGCDAVFLSNGPGDPAAVGYAVDAARGLLGKTPVFGICLGHQIMGLALGGSTRKLPFGHHGGNHPVKQFGTGQIEITSQNHGFAVDPESLGGESIDDVMERPLSNFGPLESPIFGSVEATHVNLNDGTLEGMRCKEIPAFSVQYHPEAAPGPNDAAYLFSKFRDLVATCR